MQYGNQYTYIDDAELVPLASAGHPSLRPAVPWSLSTCPSVRRSFCPPVCMSDGPPILGLLIDSSRPPPAAPRVLPDYLSLRPSLTWHTRALAILYLRLFFFYFSTQPRLSCIRIFVQPHSVLCVLSYSAPASLGALVPLR